MWSWPRLRRARAPSAPSTGALSQPHLELLAHLPALPLPDARLLRREKATGLLVVSSVGMTYAGLSCGMVHVAKRVAHLTSPLCLAVLSPLSVGILVVAYLEARLLFGDPGIIRRCPRNSLPLPTEVIEHALKSQAGAVDAHANAFQAENLSKDGRSFCVRCCVWRSPPKKASKCCPLPLDLRLPLSHICEIDEDQDVSSHHCSICQHCVTGFDHHCDLFGVCITEANMKYFRGTLVLAGFGAVYTFGLLPLSLATICLFGLQWYWAATFMLCIDCAFLRGIALWLQREDFVEKCSSSLVGIVFGINF